MVSRNCRVDGHVLALKAKQGVETKWVVADVMPSRFKVDMTRYIPFFQADRLDGLRLRAGVAIAASPNYVAYSVPNFARPADLLPQLSGPLFPPLLA